MPPGRPPKPIAADAPAAAAALGAELRRRRLEQGLTLTVLGARTGLSAQHLSSLELAKACASRHALAVIDAALGAGGALLDLVPAAVTERAFAAQARAAARERYDEDVEPTNRRGLLGAGAATALGATALSSGAPAAAREVDPALPGHWTALLAVLGRQDAVYGPHGLLAVVERELRVIGEHRAVARGGLRNELLRVEARWTHFASWLSEDTGDPAGRNARADRALSLAREGADEDMAAYVLMRRSYVAHDARRATDLAQAGRRLATSGGVRALCALKEARGHALRGDAVACGRALDVGATTTNVDYGGLTVSAGYMRAAEAHAWLSVEPRRAIGLYEDALRLWLRDRPRGHSIQRTRLALACAAAGEHDRARAEGKRALAIAKQTRSATATRELRRLGAALAAV